VGAHFVLGQRAAAPAPKPVVQVNPEADNYGCVTAIVWSPDGTEIAVLGNLQGNCGADADRQTDAIFIYNAVSGKLIEQLHPDSAVFNSPAVEHFIKDNTTPGNVPAMVGFQGLAWLPNRQALVMTFGVNLPLPDGQDGALPSLSGLLRLDVGQSGQTTVWRDTATYTQYTNGSVERWDLTDGQSAFVSAPAPATMYRWNSDGTLAPDGSAAGKPIGAPNKGQSFSIWQSGALQPAQSQLSPNGPPSSDSHDIEWNANFSPISPDGRYYYSYFGGAYGSVVPPSTTLLGAHEPKIEPHDNVLVRLATALSAKTVGPNQYPQTLVTWRPDGRLLATLNANTSGDASSAKFTVSIYDTQTGKLVKQLSPAFTGLQSSTSGNERLQWSPDGKRLLLEDNVYGAITIWGPGALPV
jgi:WD40 repeat protein